MVPAMAPEPSRPDPVPSQLLPVAEAARRLGVTEKAIRNRIKRGTLDWRPAGNHGREVLATGGGGRRDRTGGTGRDRTRGGPRPLGRDGRRAAPRAGRGADQGGPCGG